MSRGLQVATYIVTWSSFPVAITSCMLRCYCCKYIKRKWKADDVMSLVFGVFLLGSLCLWQRDLIMGCAGPEPNTCSYSNPSINALTWLFITSIYYALLHFTIRTAFFTLYLQFSAQSKFRFWISMGFGMNGMLLIANVLLVIFQCDPVTAAFKPMESMTAQCMDAKFALLAPAILNTLLNLYVLVLPLPILYSIQTPIRRKIFICGVFATGAAAVMLSFIRLHSLHILISNTNMSRGVGETMIEGALGMSLAAIAHNLPSLRVFWTHVSKSRSEVKVMSYRQCEVDSREKLQPRTDFGQDSAGDSLGNCSKPVQPISSAKSPIDRPLPALPGVAHVDVASWPRYPVIDLEFGMRPRTPPRVSRVVQGTFSSPLI